MSVNNTVQTVTASVPWPQSNWQTQSPFVFIDRAPPLPDYLQNRFEQRIFDNRSAAELAALHQAVKDARNFGLGHIPIRLRTKPQPPTPPPDTLERHVGTPPVRCVRREVLPVRARPGQRRRALARLAAVR